MKNKSNITLWNSLTLGKSTAWVLIVSYAIGMNSLCSAVTLSAVVPANISGYVGSTAFVDSQITGILGPQNAYMAPTYSGENALSGLSKYDGFCSTKDQNDVKRGSSGSYGFVLTNAADNTDSGAVLVPDGTTTWVRKVPTGATLTGTVTYTKGEWTNRWVGGTIAGYTTSSSYSDGTSSFAPYKIFCPNVPGTGSLSFNQWAPTFERSSKMHVQFFIVAPTGGLSPGKYKYPDPIYHTDISGFSGGTISELIVDNIDVIVTNYSCSLSADKQSVDLTNNASVGSLNLSVQCQDKGTSTKDPITAWLSVKSSGNSASINTGNTQMLGVYNSEGLMTIRGSWSGTAPANCNDTQTTTTMHFDGRDGINVGTVPVKGSLTKNQPASFRLCTTGSPAAGALYSAQVTFSVVQR